MKALLKWLNRIVSSIFILLIISVAAVILSNKLTDGEAGIFGYQLKTVLSGSMEPDIQTGSIIAIKSINEKASQNLQINDVITFSNPDNQLITHRIVDVTSNDSGVFYTTKGDNNNTADIAPVSPDNIVGQYQGFTIPFIGYLIQFAQSPNGIILFMITPGFVMLAYSVFTIWRTLRNLENTDRSNALETK